MPKALNTIQHDDDGYAFRRCFKWLHNGGKISPIMKLKVIIGFNFLNEIKGAQKLLRDLSIIIRSVWVKKPHKEKMWRN